MGRCRWFLFFLLFLLTVLWSDAWQAPAYASDRFPARREIVKEPTYQTRTPAYGLLVFGKEGKDQVWLVHDGDFLYVDRNGNGDLTEPGERVERQKPRKGFEDAPGRIFEVGELKLGGLIHGGLKIDASPLKGFPKAVTSRRPNFQEEIKKNPEAIAYSVYCEIEAPGIKGGAGHGRLGVLAGPIDAHGFLIFGRKPSTAPVVRFGGSIQIDFPDLKPILRPGFAVEVMTAIGFAGDGPGTFASIAFHETVPAEAKPSIDIEIPAATPGAVAYRERFELPLRCCGTCLYGPVRVDSKQVASTATVTLSFSAWKDGHVHPTRHSLEIAKSVARHPHLPVASELAWSIRYPDKAANILHQQYSPEGKRLFFSGYPSGFIQLWDLENRKEIRGFERSKESRGSSNYAQLTPDWKTLLIGEETHTTKRIEEQGKNDTLFEYSGKIQVWDVETGRQRSSLDPPSGFGAGYFQMSPNGKKLALIEMKSHRDSESEKISVVQTSVWDIETQERRVLGDSYQMPIFSSDGKFGMISVANRARKIWTIKKIDLDSGKTVAEGEFSGQGQYLALQALSPDNRWLAARLGIRADSPPITLFFDAATFKEKGRLGLTEASKIPGSHLHSFSPDSKMYETADGKGHVHLWSLEEQKVIRVIPLENGSLVRQFSPDSRFLAIAWMPKYDESLDLAREPDPFDLPQPRISLIDLQDLTRPPAVLIAPHGHCGSLAFRPDGKQLAFGSSGGVHIFDIEKLITKKEKP